MSLFKFGKNKKTKKENQTQEEVQQEILAEEKNDMIQGVEELSATTVKEVMVPRIDVDFIPLETVEEELLQKISESGHSRIPVYEGSIDNVVGILYVKDLIKILASKQAVDLEKIIRKPYFVPESKHIDSLLREFKRRHVHIVGDIQDEFDHEREDIIALADNVWICDARVDLDSLNEEISSSFPTEEFDTLGGFVFDLFGKIPVKFEKISWNNYDFIVQEM